jgi:NAD(P)-dependent dehydrogenase (short-subunit alcohol dehydrogenase family)
MTRRILLIGANSGIGLALAKRLVGRGDEVVAAGRHGDKLEELGVRVSAFDAEEAGAVLEVPDRLDGLVYFPGTITLKPFHRLVDEDFLTDFRVNCLGAARVLRQALPALKASGKASVVMFSTVAVAQGMPFHASISAAKGAVEGLARSLAAELAPVVRVNVIAPSLTDTPLAGMLLGNEAKREAAAKRHPLQRVGSADEVAALADYLLSDDAGFVTGQVMRADGGLSSLRVF